MALKTTMVSAVRSRIDPTDVLLLGNGDEKLEDYCLWETMGVRFSDVHSGGIGERSTLVESLG